MTGGSTSISLIVIGFSPASRMTISPFLLSNDPGPQQESADSGHGRAAPQDAPRPLPANFQVDCVGLVSADTLPAPRSLHPPQAIPSNEGCPPASSARHVHVAGTLEQAQDVDEAVVQVR